MNEKSQTWIEVAKILAVNPHAKVNCPECEIGIMQVRDEPFGNSGKKIDRYMICNNCGKWNVMTMESPEAKL